ncbi:MAG: hypothetical protein V3V10_02875 [Planctomycetota bacterium]
MSDPLQQPPGYGQPYPPQNQQQQVPNSAIYPAPQGFRGATRQIFNPASYKQPGSGSWAAASLIVSLVSMFLCLGLLSPISLILGFVGLFGNKRGKGLAFAGFMISAVQVALWSAVLLFGGMAAYDAQGNADHAGAPVVAAIDQFKKDNDRVPASLQELVDEGYLPATWDQGFGDADEDVQDMVKGQKWDKFLSYEPGADSDWNNGISLSKREVDGDGSSEKSGSYTRKEQNYGLAFIGVDNIWGSTDDSAVEQHQDKVFDLTSLTNMDSKARDLNKTRNALKNRLKQLEARKTQLERDVTKVVDDLVKHEETLNRMARDRNLTTLKEVKANKITADALLLIGETKKRQHLTNAQLMAIRDKIDAISIQVSRLANKEAMAKLGGSPELAAELELLLDESKEALDTDSFFDDTSGEKYADDWYKEQR